MIYSARHSTSRPTPSKILRDVKKKINLAADIAQFSLLFHSKKKKCGPFLFNTHPSRLEWKAKLTACKGSHRNPPTQKPAYVMVESRLCSWHILWTIVLWLENLQDLFFSFLFFFPFWLSTPTGLQMHFEYRSCTFPANSRVRPRGGTIRG